MNIKIIIIKLKFFWLKLTGKINTQNFNVDLKSDGHHSKNIIVIFPMDDTFFRIALYIFRDIDDLVQSCTNDLNIYYFIKDSFASKFAIKSGTFKGLRTNKKDRIVNYSKLISFISTKQFDLVIDLNTNYNLDCIRLVSFIPSKLKVGFKNSLFDNLYNIQFSMEGSGILEKGMRKMKKMIIS